jgi:hypothetical protein
LTGKPRQFRRGLFFQKKKNAVIQKIQTAQKLQHAEKTGIDTKTEM